MVKDYIKATITLVMVLNLTLLTSCSDQNEPPQKKQLRPVKTITVSIPELDKTHEFAAIVDAARKADLSFKVAGELIQFNFKQGEYVTTGQVIAKLNPRDFKVQLSEAQSSFNKAAADYNRAKSLIASNTISQADFDQLKSQYHSAQTKLDIAKNNLEYTQLKASFSGIIARKYIDNFQEVKASEPIVALHDLTDINLKIELPESIMIHVKDRDKPPKLTANFDAIKNESFPLTFKEVATQANDITKTYQVTLTMPAPKEHTILPGMTAIVKAERLIANKGPGAKFYLPAKVVLKDGQGNYVYLVTEQEDGTGRVNRRAISVGEITELGIEVLSGIAPGDKVLSAGMSKVSDGIEVKL